MKLLLSVIIVGILLLVFEKQIKRYSVVCYLVCVLLGILDVFLPKNLYPNWFSKFVTNYFQRGILATALFIIVMYAVLMPKRSRLIKTFMGLRGEIAIMASLLILIHNINYGKFYFKVLFTDIARLQMSQILAAIVSILMIALLIPLTVTSFKCVRKRMAAKNWKKLQRWSYLFYALLYVHVALIFSPQVLKGNISYVIDMCIYTVVFGVYAILRVKKYLEKQSKLDSQKISRVKIFTSVASGVVIAVCGIIILLSINGYKMQNVNAEELKLSNDNSKLSKDENDEVNNNDKTKKDNKSDNSDKSKENEINNDDKTDEILDESAISKVSNNSYKDGIWVGEGKGYYGKVKVEVTVADGEITDIKILENEDDYEYFSMAQEEITKSIIDKQSVDVDTVSGATYSSNGIKKAVTNALEKAVNE